MVTAVALMLRGLVIMLPQNVGGFSPGAVASGGMPGS
jgi:hypothetical protein